MDSQIINSLYGEKGFFDKLSIIFNDKLLHGGFTGGSNSRVSIECTLMIPKAKLK